MATVQRRGGVIAVTLLFGIMVLHFGLFEAAPQNPIGMKFVQELYLAMCVGFALLFMAGTAGNKKSNAYSTLFVYIAFTIATFTVLPALFAYLFYGQPMYYGIIEERRAMFCLSAILLLYIGQRMTASQFEKTILVTAVFAVVLSWLCYKEILPDLRPDTGNRDLSRPGRSSVGVLSLTMGYFLCLYYWHTGKSPIDGSPRSKQIYAILAMVFLLTIVFVTQTRQVLLMLAVFTILCLRGKAVVLGLIGLALVSPLILNPHLLDWAGVNVDFYIQSFSEGATDEIRQNTIEQIMFHLKENNWMPSGSLSLMWNNGFKRFFSFFFFLSDVGIFGTFFRFGLLAFVIIPVAFILYFNVARALNPNLKFVIAVFVANLVIWPLQGIFEYQQGLIAMLLVFQALRTYHAPSVVYESVGTYPPMYDSLYDINKPSLS